MLRFVFPLSPLASSSLSVHSEKKKTKDEPKVEDEHYHHPSPTVCFRTTSGPTESRDTLRLPTRRTPQGKRG